MGEVNYFLILVSVLQRFSVEPGDFMEDEDVKEMGFFHTVQDGVKLRLNER